LAKFWQKYLSIHRDAYLLISRYDLSWWRLNFSFYPSQPRTNPTYDSAYRGHR